MEGDDALTGCRERYQCCKVAITSKVAGCKSRYDCCGRRNKSVGCKQVSFQCLHLLKNCYINYIYLNYFSFAILNNIFSVIMYDFIVFITFCTKVCKKCDRLWGSPSEGCYEKPHNITTVLKTPKDQGGMKNEEYSSEDEEIDYDKSYG